ncbi:histidine phosphatase family protein [Streptomyces sp. BR1]|uniref:histidine phosphatase family protein n=1 Tax=Streptomyces sp. BR1 TaxID=1592323 RepID=UPI00402B800E
MTARTVRSLTTVRHSPTAHNTAGVITGRLDEPLSTEGRDAVRRFVAAHGVLSADVVVSSPARRAVHTATLLTGLPESDIAIDARCHERDYGLLQGLDGEQVAAFATRITYVDAGGVRHSVDPPGGETLTQLRERARHFLHAVLVLPARSVLVVSHGTFLQQVHGVLLRRSAMDTLACHVRNLQVDRFTLSADGEPRHHQMHAGLDTGLLW